MRRRGSALALSLSLAASALGFTAPAVAQDAGSEEVEEVVEFTLAELLPESQIFHPDVLSQVMPVSGRLDELRANLTVAMLDAVDADERRLDGLRRRSEARVESWSQRVVVGDRLVDEEVAAAVADVAFDRLGVFAVDSFLGSEAVDLARLTVDGAMSPLPELSDSAAEVIEERYALAKAQLSETRQARVDAESEAAHIATRIEVATADVEQAVVDLGDADQRIADLRPQLERTVQGLSVPGTDMSLVVIDAYFRASIQMAERRPGCGISWDQLAGVGLIESRHGSYGGNTVGFDGRTSGEILGPVLDGDPFAAIPDSEGGALDGNTEWDRAVGPMQFIPTSWQIYGLDGNADGLKDPHNLYDAAYAAAEHLCRGYSGIQGDAVYRRALLGYNRSAVYGSDVMAARRGYAAAVSLKPTEAGMAEDLERRGIAARVENS